MNATWDFRKNLFIHARLGRSGKWCDTAGGRKIYYETYGAGKPLFLLHGGFSSLMSFRYQIPELSRHFQLFLPERPGNGHMPDLEGDYDYDQMADELIAVMDALGISKASMAGSSDGANLLLPLALKAPERIEKMILVGGNFHYDGCLPANEFAGDFPIVRDRYFEKYSPVPLQNYSKLFKKFQKLWETQPTYTVEQIQKITTPTLLLFGDKDMFTAEHVHQFYQALPNSQLGILPNTTHSLIKESPDLVNRMILDFLQK